MTREVIESQNIYARAALHYIERSCRKSVYVSPAGTGSSGSGAEKVQKVVNAVNSSDTSLDFSNLLIESNLMASPSKLDQKAQKHLSNALGSAEGHRSRIKELVEDCCLAKLTDPDASLLLKQNPASDSESSFDQGGLRHVLLRGTAFQSSDFISSLMSLNRTQFNRNLKEEGRRYVLYGSDSII